MNTLAELLKEFGLKLNDKQLELFELYYEYLIEKNKVMNLTRITKKEEVIEKHFIDSLSICKAVDFFKKDFLETLEEGKKIKIPSDCRVLDMGTGAGFPGIPLKLIFPEMEMVLVDSLKKRILFLEEVVSKLHLKKIIAVHGRAEDLARDKNYREKFQLCVSRAVANLSVLAEYCLPFVEIGGYFISYKSSHIEDELLEGKKAISILGGELIEKKEFLLPQSDIERTLIIIKKVKPTKKEYPRNAGKPAKEPIHS